MIGPYDCVHVTRLRDTCDTRLVIYRTTCNDKIDDLCKIYF